MAAIEDSIRRTGTASKRRNKTVDEDGESTLEPTSKGTLATTPPPTYASVIAREPTSKGTLGAAHVPPSDHASDNALDLAPKGTSGATHVPASDNASDDDLESALSDAHEPTMSGHLAATLSSAEAIQSKSVSQYRSLSERVDSIEQRWQESDASTSQLQDIDAHMRYVLKTFERTDERIAKVELHSSHMEAVLVELRGASATDERADILVRTHVHDTVELLVQPRLLEIATAQSAATSDTLKRVNLLEADVVTELNAIKTRLLEVEPRLYLPAPDDELLDARVSALETRLRLDVGDQGLNLTLTLELRAKLSITSPPACILSKPVDLGPRLFLDSPLREWPSLHVRLVALPASSLMRVRPLAPSSPALCLLSCARSGSYNLAHYMRRVALAPST